jgi:hypothetical protein
VMFVDAAVEGDSLEGVWSAGELGPAKR